MNSLWTQTLMVGGRGTQKEQLMEQEEKVWLQEERDYAVKQMSINLWRAAMDKQG